VPGAKRRPAYQLRLFSQARTGVEGGAEAAKAEAVQDPAERARAIAVALGAWFEVVARDLPWRRERAPYSVWLSEIMLQQTRVDTVVPYFQRFLARFPDVRTLAAAELDDVLHLWSGLGYYRRARQLHATAREVTERYGGVFPAEAKELRALPGIGAYTAGAIASIAYGKREPLVDGNVARVLARLEGIADPIKSPSAVRRAWATAARLLPDDRPGRFNEALMELGATVCTPRDPRCEACPLAPFCVARASGLERELPVTESKRAVPVVEAVAAVLVDAGGLVLFARRREGGLFGGLWEPPMIEGGSSSSTARPRFEAMGIGIGRGRLSEAGQVTHVLSHRRMVVTVTVGDRPKRIAAAADLAAPYEKASWLDPEKPGVGVSTLARKVLAAARRFGRGDEKG
jgi:A/G-specific adenine glycosylase